MIKKCEYCFDEFKTDDKRKKYCSRDCYFKNKKQHKITVNCCVCERKIKRYPSECLNKIYCSKECLNKQINVKCDNCQKEIKVKFYKFEKEKYHFCSRKCKDEANNKFYSGINNPFYNKKHSIETKTKISKANKGRYIGDKSPNWNPLISNEERIMKRNYIEYNEFVKKVLERDNYTCQLSNKRGGNLVVHHLNSYDWDKKNRLNESNAITISEKIHKQFHKKYGYGKNTIEQFEEFKKNLTC